MEKFTLGNGLSTTTSYNPQKGYITGMVTPGIQNWAYTFNTVGNLSDRKDNLKNLTEHFDYDELNRLWKVSQNGTLKQEILYDAAGNITSKTGVGTSFVYQNGTNRLLSVSGSGYNPLVWDSIQYTSFNKISNIKQGANSLALVYGVNKERKKSVTAVNNVLTQTKYYVGNLFEEEENTNSNVHTNYIFANGVVIAIAQVSKCYEII